MVTLCINPYFVGAGVSVSLACITSLLNRKARRPWLKSVAALVPTGFDPLWDVTAPGRTDPLGLDFITETCRTMFSELLARA